MGPARQYRAAPVVEQSSLRGKKARSGWEAARLCVSKEAKPAKIVSLIEKIFCARPLKEKEIQIRFSHFCWFLQLGN